MWYFLDGAIWQTDKESGREPRRWAAWGRQRIVSRGRSVWRASLDRARGGQKGQE